MMDLKILEYTKHKQHCKLVEGMASMSSWQRHSVTEDDCTCGLTKLKKELCESQASQTSENSLNISDVMRIVCPNCGCSKMQDDRGNYYTCLNILCDFHGQIMP